MTHATHGVVRLIAGEFKTLAAEGNCNLDDRGRLFVFGQWEGASSPKLKAATRRIAKKHGAKVHVSSLIGGGFIVRVV